jgi:hypothetical protein
MATHIANVDAMRAHQLSEQITDAVVEILSRHPHHTTTASDAGMGGVHMAGQCHEVVMHGAANVAARGVVDIVNGHPVLKYAERGADAIGNDPAMLKNAARGAAHIMNGPNMHRRAAMATRPGYSHLGNLSHHRGYGRGNA